MPDENEFFTPDDVDRQIERISRGEAGERADAEAIAYLHGYYQHTRQEQESLNRIWSRIARATSQHEDKKGTGMSIHEQPALYKKTPSHKKQTTLQRLGTVAAVVFLTALVGSMIVVFNAVHHSGGQAGNPGKSSSTGSGGTHIAATPTPHPGGAIGTIVYSTKVSVADGLDVYGLGWSPDGPRVGVATLRAQSWDATTGKHIVDYGSLQSGSILSIVWSPDGKRVAITGVGFGVRIYDATTGKLQGSYPHNSSPVGYSQQSGGGYMSATLRLSGGTGTMATAWSPDGKLMATSFFGSYGNVVQVWNTTTDKLVTNYTGHSDTVMSLSWSPDGKYIASASVDGSTQVWDALSGQKKFDFENNARGNNGVAWSPDSLTFAYLDGDQVKVVDGFNGKVILTHTGPNDKWGLSDLCWSPDGKSIASAGDHIELWHVATGKTYYTFRSNPNPIRVLAWSPNGQYIVSADSPETTNSIIQVWVAG